MARASAFLTTLVGRADRLVLVRAVLLALLGLAGAFCVLPLRYAAHADLAFRLSVQPPAEAVGGVMQVLTSRDMARDVVARLPSADIAALAARRFGGTLKASADAATLAARAAARLPRHLTVGALQSGRVLRMTAKADDPARAARIANAYADAFLALDRDARAERPDTGLDATTLDLTAPATEADAAIDPPNLPALTALALLALAVLLLGRARPQSEAAEDGPIGAADLPVEIASARQITWLETPREGPCGTQVSDLLLPLVQRDGARLVVMTSEDVPHASADCAIQLARRLAQEARVALVALDGSAQEMCAILADPFAAGVSELLFGVAGFGEAIHRDPHSRAHVIPPGRDARGDAGMVGADRLGLILGALQKTYDHVVVAAPSLGTASGAERLAALDPLVVCLYGDARHQTVAVERFDALAAHHFHRVAMVRLPGRLGRAPATGLEAPALEPPIRTAAPRRRRLGRAA